MPIFAPWVIYKPLEGTSGALEVAPVAVGIDIAIVDEYGVEVGAGKTLAVVDSSRRDKI